MNRTLVYSCASDVSYVIYAITYAQWLLVFMMVHRDSAVTVNGREEFRSLTETCPFAAAATAVGAVEGASVLRLANLA